MQGIPILARLYGLGCNPMEVKPRVRIPCDMGFVSMIGMYHGEGKPDLWDFLVPTLKELKELHPLGPPRIPKPMVGASDVQEYRLRKVSVLLRSLICDAKERPPLKGTLIFKSKHAVFIISIIHSRMRFQN